MKELKDYTTDELRTELKRRHIESLKSFTRAKPRYIEVYATVEDIKSKHAYVCNEYKLNITDERVPSVYRSSWYHIKREKFRKDTIPKVGDTVILGHLLTKARPGFTFSEARILEVVKHKN